MGMTNDRAKVLQAIKDARVPMLVSMGDADEAVPVANVRMWVDTMKELQMTYEYKEHPGVTHGPIMAASMPVFTHSSPHTPSSNALNTLSRNPKTGRQACRAAIRKRW